MEALLILAALVVIYQSGALAPLGLVPSGPLLRNPQQAISDVIAQEEQQAYARSGNQPYAPNSTLGLIGGSISGASAGYSSSQGSNDSGSGSTGSTIVSSVLGALTGAISSVFAGMALRARQATIENQALNYAVQAFDQAMAQVNAAYNNGQLNAQDAVTLIQQIWQQYWGVMGSKIQPNRNGCANGTNCPGTAMQYEMYNGAPGPCPGSSCYCAGDIGATCCVGCGPIRLSVERAIAAIQNGGGRMVVAPIGGDHYGLQTRLGYQLTWGHA